MKSQCYQEEVRTCTRRINGNLTVEKRHVPCPKKRCLFSRVEVEKAYAIQGKRYAPRAKNCVLPGLNLTITEYEYVHVEEDQNSDMFKIIITCSTILSFLLGIFSRTCSCCKKNSHNKKIDKEHVSRSHINKSDFGKSTIFHDRFTHRQSYGMWRDFRDSPCLEMQFSFKVVFKKCEQICC